MVTCCCALRLLELHSFKVALKNLPQVPRISPTIGNLMLLLVKEANQSSYIHKNQLSLGTNDVDFNSPFLLGFVLFLRGNVRHHSHDTKCKIWYNTLSQWLSISTQRKKLQMWQHDEIENHCQYLYIWQDKISEMFHSTSQQMLA